MSEQRLMKNGLGEAAIGRMAESLALTIPDFPKQLFCADAMKGLDSLELKGRVRHIIGVLSHYLPNNFEETAVILVQLKDHFIPGELDDNLSGFAAWPIIDYVGEYGLGHPETALETLRELTSLFSAEFAIRPFFIAHRELTLKVVHEWCSDPDEHVRRLASEGSRPRLPWGQQLPRFIADPSPVFHLLEKLKGDPSAYVRRSVANNLNDISKDHPEKVIALCRRWQQGATKERQWIIRHATRTLVKAGHAEVFGLLGYTENPQLDFQSLKIGPPEIKLGESIEFTFQLQSTHAKPQSIVIDYAIHHRKASGKTSPKVFKFRNLNIAPGEIIELSKRHAIMPITTRNYYPGAHAVEILINGKTFGDATFTLRFE